MRSDRINDPLVSRLRNGDETGCRPELNLQWRLPNAGTPGTTSMSDLRDQVFDFWHIKKTGSPSTGRIDSAANSFA